MDALDTLNGFGNSFSSEAAPGALPVGRNSPQPVAHGLCAELLSGSTVTAPRAENHRTWMYRRRPSVVTSHHKALVQAGWKTGAKDGVAALPNPMRWHPMPHGPDGQAFERASTAALAPHKLDHALAFLFESRWRFHLSAWAPREGARDARCADCWAALQNHFKA